MSDDRSDGQSVLSSARDYDAALDKFVKSIKRRQVQGAYAVTIKTIELFHGMISRVRASSPSDLIDSVRLYGKKLIRAIPSEITVSNAVKHILHLVREDYKTLMEGEGKTGKSAMASAGSATAASAGSAIAASAAAAAAAPAAPAPATASAVPSAPTSGGSAASAPRVIGAPLATAPHGLAAVKVVTPPGKMTRSDSGDLPMQTRPALLSLMDPLVMRAVESQKIAVATQDLKRQALESLRAECDDIRSVFQQIAGQAREHIHANEIVMTFGKSKSVEEFLKAAKKDLSFSVIVVETGPDFEQAHEMALALSQTGIDTTLIPDAAVYAVMSRVNKVIMGTHTVLSNGGLIAAAGGRSFALAARAHGVPLIVLTPVYKLCPLLPHDLERDLFGVMSNPSRMFGFETPDVVEQAAVLAPIFDYIPPEMVGYYITDTGYAYHPTYVHRLLLEYYSPEDFNLEIEEDVF